MSAFIGSHRTCKARKRHICSFCGEAIDKGEVYWRSTGIYDERWFLQKLHDECDDELRETGWDTFTLYSNERPPK